MLCNASKHSGTDFFPIMKRKGEIGVAHLLKDSMRPFLSFDPPPGMQQYAKNFPRFNGVPLHVPVSEKRPETHGLALSYLQAYATR